MTFFFLQSRPRLSSLIPHGYVDIHSHLLPGLDDGVKNVQETRALLEKARGYGFAQCITTPHTLEGIWEHSRQDILDSLVKTRDQLPPFLQHMLAGAASEYMLDHSLLKRLQEEELLCLKDRYLLVEMSYLEPPAGLHEILFELKLKGYQPVLAHPERYLYFKHSISTYEQLKSEGFLFQLNLLSVTGYYGPEVLFFADQLLRRNVIDVVGSDMHHLRHLEALTQQVRVRSRTQLEEALSRNAMFTPAVA